jgi:hypothetical protein
MGVKMMTGSADGLHVCAGEWEWQKWQWDGSGRKESGIETQPRAFWRYNPPLRRAAASKQASYNGDGAPLQHPTRGGLEWLAAIACILANSGWVGKKRAPEIGV